MSGWLVDTNILSAFAPGRPPPGVGVVAWFEDHADDLFLSTIAAAEIEAGIAKLRRAGSVRRADELLDWFDRMLALYGDRILPFDLAAARIAGAISDAAYGAGRHPGFADIAVAAIARSRGLTILTANRRHFDPLGVDAYNPFEGS